MLDLSLWQVRVVLIAIKIQETETVSLLVRMQKAEGLAIGRLQQKGSGRRIIANALDLLEMIVLQIAFGKTLKNRGL